MKIRPDVKVEKGDGGKNGYYAGIKISLTWEEAGDILKKIKNFFVRKKKP